MNAEEMWIEYKKTKEGIEDKYQAWSFGANGDLLADLVMRGKKTATTSAYVKNLKLYLKFKL